MEISGKIVQVLPLQTGEGKNGTWKKQEFVLETNSQYPKKVCISMWGDKIEDSLIQAGVEVTASIDVESREYNGRWYTDVKAWKLDAGSGAPSTSGEAASSYSAPAPVASSPIPAALEGEDDLPF